MSDTVIAHVDLDAFYASVEIRDDPSLRGRPVVVGGQSDRSVVAAASYEARRFGIHSAMPMVRARKACKDLVVITPRIGHYAAESERFFQILGRYSPLVEGLSLDEAFLDLTGTATLLGPPAVAIANLRKEVMDTLGLACSAGIAPVKFVAKIASDLAKPNGQLEVSAQNLLATLHPLPVSRLWGVGKTREAELAKAGLKTIGDLARTDLAALRARIGDEAARHLHALANGRDDRAIVPDREAKSMGAEETFETDLRDPELISLYLLEQAERVAARLRRNGLTATGVTLKYKLADFTLVTRQATIPATADGPTLHRTVARLLAQNPPKGPIRLVGLSASKLGPPPLPDLLSASDPGDEKRARLNATLDEIRQRHGQSALQRARLLELDRKAPEARPAGYEAPPKRR